MINQISEQLWVTDIDAIKTESIPSEIDVIVTVCQDNIEDHVPIDVEYVQFNMADGDTGYGGDPSFELFEDAVDFVVSKCNDGDSVLVHCHAGQSRSPAVCIAALARTTDTQYGTAFTVVQKARDVVDPMPELRRYAFRYCEIYGVS